MTIMLTDIDQVAGLMQPSVMGALTVQHLYWDSYLVKHCREDFGVDFISRKNWHFQVLVQKSILILGAETIFFHAATLLCSRATIIVHGFVTGVGENCF